MAQKRQSLPGLRGDAKSLAVPLTSSLGRIGRRAEKACTEVPDALVPGTEEGAAPSSRCGRRRRRFAIPRHDSPPAPSPASRGSESLELPGKK
ncbi:hypothetical protein MTO96_000793 [Rhipicephalus appendiculatus]